MPQIRAMIVDDEQLVLDNLKYLFLQTPEVSLVAESTDSARAVSIIEEGLRPDVIFMDISMPGADGLTTARRIYQIAPSIKIVFLTAYDRYVMDAFDVNTVDYILKPITARRLQRSLGKIARLLEQEKTVQAQIDGDPGKYPDVSTGKASRFVGFRNNFYYVIAIDDGYFLKIEGRELLLYTKDAAYLLKHNLNYWEEELRGKGWVRCNRSYMVNVNHIKSFTPMYNSTYSVLMEEHEEEIPVSRSYLEAFQKILGL